MTPRLPLTKYHQIYLVLREQLLEGRFAKSMPAEIELAKQFSVGRVTIRHALRNAMIPVVTLVGLQIGFLLGGSIVTETMFAWPGVGRMAVGAITSNDFPLAQGAILILAVGFMVVNLIVDVLYAYLDPRIARS